MSILTGHLEVANTFLKQKLCDGGGTFVGIAELLKENCPDRPKSIFVTHAVNPKGIDNMSKHYDNVYITNSYRDWAGCPENVTIIDVI